MNTIKNLKSITLGALLLLASSPPAQAAPWEACAAAGLSPGSDGWSFCVAFQAIGCPGQESYSNPCQNQLAHFNALGLGILMPGTEPPYEVLRVMQGMWDLKVNVISANATFGHNFDMAVWVEGDGAWQFVVTMNLISAGTTLSETRSTTFSDYVDFNEHFSLFVDCAFPTGWGAVVEFDVRVVAPNGDELFSQTYVDPISPYFVEGYSCGELEEEDGGDEEGGGG